MPKGDWIPIREVSDDTKIWSGNIVRVYRVNNCKEQFYDYIVSSIYDNSDYLQLTCLAQGELGNIVCVLETKANTNYSLGKELKRIMDDGTNSVFVNFNPECIVR